jgi:His-Xaa-Ser system protein HxsD
MEPDGIQSDSRSESSARIYLDPRIFSREAILRASYWATATAYIRVPESPDDRLVVDIELKQTFPTLAKPKPITIHEFVKEFCNSLVDFELRRQVELETSKVRELILAKAFSESGVLEEEPPGTIADPVETRKPSSLVQLIAPVTSPSQ